ncbi:hypothetical protein BaRGS_00001164 [Batillaria attramentaria]|uniref:Uncharacterized protein n=1 Tax=Batillaria attramentaria TaxID=370345 RepID=A0ABD0M5K7_9CAEN
MPPLDLSLYIQMRWKWPGSRSRADDLEISGTDLPMQKRAGTVVAVAGTRSQFPPHQVIMGEKLPAPNTSNCRHPTRALISDL